MRNIGKTLIDRIRALPNKISSIKNAVYAPLKSSILYAPILAASLALPSYSHAQTRETLANETFTGGVITSNYLAEDPAKWEITGEKLQVKDFDEDWGDTEVNWGYTRFSIVDTNTLCKTEKNASLEAVFEVSQWGVTQQVGFSIGDPTMLKNGTYYKIGINAHPDRASGKAQFQIARVSPGFSFSYHYGLTDIIPAGTKNIKLKFSHDNAGYHLFLNDIELDAGSTAIINRSLPPIEGYPILTIFDGSDDAHTPTITTFDNIVIEADAAGGGSLAPKRIRQNLLGKGGQVGRPITPQEIPHRFKRGDSNMDGRFDISDPINTLLYAYLGQGNVRCPDAADANDDGALDLSDAVLSLTSQFVDTSIKLPPPNMIEKNGKLIMDAAEGIDTTKDNLPPCEGY